MRMKVMKTVAAMMRRMRKIAVTKKRAKEVGKTKRRGRGGRTLLLTFLFPTTCSFVDMREP
jgi:hypothetical protein